MNKFDELLKTLNSLEIEQTDLELIENIPKHIYNEHFENWQIKECDLDIDRRRWYETSTTVVKVYDRFLGIRGITYLYSESMDISDCEESLDFFEMEQFKTISYRPINN